MNKFIEHNGQKYKIPETLEDFAEMMTMKKIVFNAIKRDKFNNNSILIKLVDSYFQSQSKNKELFFPELRTFSNETISIFSDYGGEHTESKYNSYSILFCGWNHSWGAIEKFNTIREKYKLDKKEIAFKDLKFGPTQRALDEYLNSLNENVYGFLFTVLIEKDIKSLFIGKGNLHLLKEIENAGLGYWKEKNAEKLMRILHLISYVLPLISSPNQKIFWMTDQDSIVANKKMFENTFKLFEAVLKIYTDNKYSLIGGATPFKETDVYTMDLLSITDLVAGCVEQYFSTKKNNEEPSIKKGAEKVIKWLSTQGIGLKKEVICIYLENDAIKIDGIKFKQS